MSFMERFVLGESVDEEEKEVLIFGIERIKVTLIGFIAITVMGLILGEFIETVIFIICLLPLRQNAGGYHMKNKWACAVCSYTILLLSVLVIKYLTVGRVSALLITLSSVALICIAAPVGNSNHMLDELENKIYGARAKVICLAELTLFLIFFLVENPRWYKIIMLSELITGTLLAIGLIQEKILKVKGIEDV